MRFAHLVLVVVTLGCGSSSTDARVVPRPVVSFNGSKFGAVCSKDSDCGPVVDSCCKSGECSPQGWCSPRCNADRECPPNFYCIDHSGTRCFMGCASDRDCPTDFVCEEKSGLKVCRYKT